MAHAKTSGSSKHSIKCDRCSTDWFDPQFCFHCVEWGRVVLLDMKIIGTDLNYLWSYDIDHVRVVFFPPACEHVLRDSGEGGAGAVPLLLPRPRHRLARRQPGRIWSETPISYLGIWVYVYFKDVCTKEQVIVRSNWPLNSLRCHLHFFAECADFKKIFLIHLEIVYK